MDILNVFQLLNLLKCFLFSWLSFIAKYRTFYLGVAKTILSLCPTKTTKTTMFQQQMFS